MNAFLEYKNLGLVFCTRDDKFAKLDFKFEIGTDDLALTFTEYFKKYPQNDFLKAESIFMVICC